MAAAVEPLGQRLGEGDAVAFDHEVDIFVRPLEENVAHQATDQENRCALRIGHLGGSLQDPLHPRRRDLAQQAKDRLADRTLAGHPVVECRAGGVLVLVEPSEKLHAGDDAGRATILHDDHEAQ